MSAMSYPVGGGTTPSRGRPGELDDRQWLKTRLLTVGERAIAEELGVSRGTVTRARQRLGIDAQGPGRKRGGLTVVPTRRENDHGKLPAAIERIWETFSDDNAAPSEQLLAKRIVNLHHARGTSDYARALADLGSAVALNLEHELTLRRIR